MVYTMISFDMSHTYDDRNDFANRNAYHNTYVTVIFDHDNYEISNYKDVASYKYIKVHRPSSNFPNLEVEDHEKKEYLKNPKVPKLWVMDLDNSNYSPQEKINLLVNNDTLDYYSDYNITVLAFTKNSDTKWDIYSNTKERTLDEIITRKVARLSDDSLRKIIANTSTNFIKKQKTKNDREVVEKVIERRVRNPGLGCSLLFESWESIVTETIKSMMIRPRKFIDDNDDEDY